MTVWDEIQFPFDPALRDAGQRAGGSIRQAAQSQEIEEKYSIDASGTVTITITNLTAGYERKYRLGRWAVEGCARQSRPKPRMRHCRQGSKPRRRRR